MDKLQISNEQLEAVIADAGALDKVLAKGVIEADWIADPEVAAAWRRASDAMAALQTERDALRVLLHDRRWGAPQSPKR